MKYNIAVIEGDGIGPEVCKEAVNVLDAVAKKYNHQFVYNYVCAGGVAIDKFGNPLPDESLEACKNSDAVLLGAVGGPKWDNLEDGMRPENALLKLRSSLNLYANLRPAILYSPLKEASPLKDELIEGGIDILVVRELTGGIYFGDRKTIGDTAYDTEKYSVSEIKRIAITAFEAAQKRNKKVVSVDKANILDTSRLWRKVVNQVSKDYPDVELSHMYVDNAAMQLVRYPKQFDVILTSNMFGDILSDEASMITGSIGMLPSASLGAKNPSMYEPIHGSAPDIAGKGLANPLATILSVAMLLKYSFSMEKEGAEVENAVMKVLEKGYRTKDICAGKDYISTSQMGEKVKSEILAN